MKMLEALPLELSREDDIVAIMTATNKYGPGMDSEASATVSLKSKPQRLSAPTFDEANKKRDSVVVEWESTMVVTGEEVNYELLLSSDDKDFERVYYGRKTSFLATAMNSQTRYKFKVRAVNICGIGESSSQTLITFANVPRQPPTVSTTRTRCDVRIDWEKPSEDGGNAINDFLIEAKANDGKFYRLDACGKDLSVTYCSLNFRVFYMAPFLLEGGELIEIRVSAGNALGYSKPSPINRSGVILVRKPEKMAAPILVKKGVDSISLSWEKAREDPNEKKGEVIYTILWSTGNGEFK